MDFISVAVVLVLLALVVPVLLAAVSLQAYLFYFAISALVVVGYLWLIDKFAPSESQSRLQSRLGLCQVYAGEHGSAPDGADAGSEHDLAVVFVHGLGANPSETWKLGKTCWITHLLPMDLRDSGLQSRVRLFTFNYKSFWIRHSNQNLRTIGNSLRQQITKKIPHDDIVLVGHSYGGLVIKQALVLSWELKSRLKGIVFLGTPHNGSSLNRYGLLASVILAPLDPDIEIMRVLGPDSRTLWELETDFKKHFNDTTRKYFFESEKMRRKLLGFIPYMDEFVVTQASATLGAEEEMHIIALDTDHRGLNKFSDAQDHNYRQVAEELLDILQTPKQGSRDVDERGLRSQAPLPRATKKSDGYEADAVHAATKDCLLSLAFPEMNKRHNEVDKATKGTCEWLFRHDVYRRWRSSHKSCLWIKGKPGSGKSTLLKHALCNAAQTAGDETLVLSFFFHGRGCDLQKTPHGLFRSLLHQLLVKDPVALRGLVETFDHQQGTIGTQGDKWVWHPQELHDLFESSLARVLERHSVRLFIDALDECGEKQAVELVEVFERLIQDRPSTAFDLGIFFTCRQYPILKLDWGLEVTVDRENKGDISSYVRARLPGPRHMQVAEAIKTRAEGIFLWAHLAVNRVRELERRGETALQIQESIQRIPSELHELYRHLVEGMLDKPASLKLIQWIYFAKRPMKLDELRWAMVLDVACPYKTLEQFQGARDYVQDNETMERRVKALSCGLAETLHVKTRDGRKASTVQFIHQSVKDFFFEEGLSALDAALQSATLAAGEAHYRLSRSCIRFLALDDAARWVPTEDATWADLVIRHPFLGYATTCWPSHAKQSEDHGVPQVDLLDYFAWPSEALVQAWACIYNGIDEISADCPSERTSFVHVMSSYGLAHPLSVALQKADRLGVDIDCRDHKGRTPLSWAATRGHDAVVRLLIGTGKVEIDSRDDQGRTPFSKAAGSRAEAVVKLFVDTCINSIDVNSQDVRGWTPLIWAIHNGNPTVVELLLDAPETGLDLNAKDAVDRTALSWAAGNRIETMAKLLLATKKVDVNVKDKTGRTPLSYASGFGRKATVELLLASDMVDTDGKDRAGRTPLSWAATAGHEAVVKLLLETKKVEVDQSDNNGRTPLSCAASYGRDAVLKLLLDTGQVNVNSRDKYGRTVLSRAAASCHYSTVKLLLTVEKVKADIRKQRNNVGQTPLLYAAKNKREDIVELLLDVGEADPNLADRDGRTPLWWATNKGFQTVVKLILASDRTDPNLTDRAGLTALSLAAQNGDEAVVKLVLASAKADANVADKEGRTALWWAANRGHETVVELLLASQKADPNVHDNSGRTALWCATKKRHGPVVKLLLAAGALMGEEDDETRPSSGARGTVLLEALVVFSSHLTAGSVPRRPPGPRIWHAPAAHGACSQRPAGQRRRGYDVGPSSRQPASLPSTSIQQTTT